MAVTSFSPKEAIKFGWQIVKKNLVFFVVIELIVLFAGQIVSILEPSIREGENGGLILLLVNLATMFVQAGLSLGMVSIMLQAVTKKKLAYENLFSKFDPVLMLKYLIAGILYILTMIVGLLLFIIPGIIFAVRLSFYPYVLVDKKTGPIEALKRSWEMTNGRVCKLLIYGLISFGVFLLGLLALAIGLLVAIPVISLGQAHIYRKLSTRGKK